MIVLAASLGLNFFAAGYLFHGKVNPPPAPPPSVEGRGFENPRGLMRLANELPDESREAFRREIRTALPQMRDQHRRMRALRGELRVLVEADDWDGDAVAAKMDDIRAVRSAQTEAFDKAYTKALGAVPAEDRRRLIEIAEKRRADRRERWRDRRRPE
jgi:uncharacterized membrane protein